MPLGKLRNLGPGIWTGHWVRGSGRGHGLSPMCTACAVSLGLALMFLTAATAQQHLLRGTVRDAEGLPVAGVTVRTSDGYNQARTAEDGSYELELSSGEHVVAVVDRRADPNLRLHSAMVSIPADTVLHIALEKYRQLVLRYVDEAGEGIPRVVIRVESGITYGNQTGAHWSDSLGVIRIEAPPDVYEIWYDSVPVPFLKPSSNGFVQVRSDTSVAIVLRRGVAFTGRLVNDRGARVAGTLGLRAEDGSESFWTDNTRPLSVPPGRYHVTARSGYELGQELGTVTVRADTTIDFVLSPGVSVGGRILGFGDVLSGRGYRWRVAFQGPDGGGSAQLDSTGAFSIRLVPGTYDVNVWTSSQVATSGLPASQPLGEVEVSADTVMTLNLAPESQVEGRLVDVNGRAVPGWLVYVSGVGVHGRVYTRTRADSTGAFALGLPDGTYTLHAEPRLSGGCATDRYSAVDLVVPSPEPVICTIPGGARLQARTHDGSGHPASTILELWSGPFDLRRYLHAWRDVHTPRSDLLAYIPGSRVVDVTPGRYAALVSYESWGHRGAPYERVISGLLLEGDTELDVSMPPRWGDHTLAGEVVPGSDQGAEDAMVYFFEAELGLLASTDARDGSYSIRLPTGLYRVLCRTPANEWEGTLHEAGTVFVDGDRVWDLHLGRPTAVADAATTPNRFYLRQNYPNPFNPATTITYELAETGPVSLVIYNALGQRVRTLVHQFQEPGAYTAHWDGCNDAGAPLASGLYVYRLIADDRFRQTRRMLLLR